MLRRRLRKMEEVLESTVQVLHHRLRKWKMYLRIQTLHHRLRKTEEALENTGAPSYATENGRVARGNGCSIIGYEKWERLWRIQMLYRRLQKMGEAPGTDAPS